MKYIVLTSGALAIVFAIIIGVSASDGQMPLSGNAELGREAAQTCVACHGAAGISSLAGVPHLAGQHADYIASALADYRAGVRQEAGMRAIAAEMSDEDIRNLAAYFSALAPFSSAEGSSGIPGPPLAPKEENPLLAIQETTALCAGCHGADGNSAIPGIPSIAGQSEQYLIAVLKAYRDGSRADETMQAFIGPMADKEIEDAAFFYAAMEPKPADTPVAGDPYAGMATAETCASCHGDDGNSGDPGTPRLAGLDAAYLESAIRAYISGVRENTVMQQAVSTLRDGEIADVSAFFANEAPQALSMGKPLTTSGWAERCDRCHGLDGISSDPRFPILAGQSEAYLVTALNLYHHKDRPNSTMFAMTFQLSTREIRNLAKYYATRRAK